MSDAEIIAAYLAAGGQVKKVPREAPIITGIPVRCGKFQAGKAKLKAGNKLS